MSACIFCQIASGQLQAALVFADEHCLAFLDHRPLFPGHVLLIPRAHYDTLMSLPEELISPLFANAQRLAKAVLQAMSADGVFVGINNIVSQSVPHLHIHIVPRKRGDGLKGFFWPRHKYSSEAEMQDIARRIKNTLMSIL